MKNSASYTAIEAMLQQGWVTMNFAELEKYLDTFEQKRLITPSERLALLELAREKKIPDSYPPQLKQE